MNIVDLTKGFDPQTLSDHAWGRLIAGCGEKEAQLLGKDPIYRMLYDVGFADGGLALIAEVARRAPDIKAAAVLDILRGAYKEKRPS